MLKLVIFFVIAQTVAAEEILDFSKNPSYVQLTPAEMSARQLKYEKELTKTSCAREEAAAATAKKATDTAVAAMTIVKGSPEFVGERRRLSEPYSKARTVLRTCVNEARERNPFQAEADLFEEPARKGKKVGSLLFRLNSSPLDSYYIFRFLSLDGKSVDFKSDLFINFSSIEPSYHTVLARKGNWVKLPKGPFPSGVWVEFGKDSQFGEIKIKALKDQSPVIFATDSFSGPGKLTYADRDLVRGESIYVHEDCSEECSDTPASAKESGGSQAPPVENPRPSKRESFVPKSFSIPIKDLFDENGHIRANPVVYPECACC
jgi:hypothetical protein